MYYNAPYHVPVSAWFFRFCVSGLFPVFFCSATLLLLFLARFVLLSSFTQKPLPSRLSHTHTHTYTRARLDTSRSNVYRRDDWADELR